jgi:hypothetical protein
MAFKKWREKASPSGGIGTGALKVAVYIKSCPQKPRLLQYENEDRAQAGNVQSK